MRRSPNPWSHDRACSQHCGLCSDWRAHQLSGLIQRYGKDAATSEKLQRLEMLLIKIHSAVEASEKRAIGSPWLLRWHNKLKEAASRGDEVLARFLQRAQDAQGTSNTDANQQQGEAASSSTADPATTAGMLSFTRSSLSGIVQGICSATKMLFWRADDDMERLNKTLRWLEELSPDIGEFLRLIHLEALPTVDQTSYSTALTAKVRGLTTNTRKTREKKRMKRSTPSDPSLGPSLLSFSPPKVEMGEGTARGNLLASRGTKSRSTAAVLDFELLCSSAVLRKELQLTTIIESRLEVPFASISKAVDLAGSRDLQDLEWLAYWAGILQEAKQQGCAILGAISAGKTINNEGSAVEFDQEKDELDSFVRRLETLATDVEYFNELVYLCRAC